MRERPEGLVSARADGWLVGGAAIVLWLVITTQRALHAPATPGISGGLYWIFITMTAAHFGASYHLAYTDREAGVRRHPLALVAVPAACCAAVLAVWILPRAQGSADALRVLISVVFALTIWHYAKQAYGVARLGLSLAGARVSRGQNLVLRYSLYPLWLLSLVELATKGRDGSMFGYPVGVGLLPAWVTSLARAGCVLALVAFVATIVIMSRQTGRRLPAAVWAPHVAGFLWIGFGPGYQSTAVVLASLHAVQYLACVHRAERTWATERAQPQPNLWLLCVFGAAGAGGLFVTNWFAPVLAATVGGTSTTTAFAAGLFVILNLHHYAIDAVIWRSTGSHVKRIARSAAPRGVAPNGGLEIPTPGNGTPVLVANPVG